MDRRKHTGRQGEDIATAYLLEKGYSLVQRNWRCSSGELDIIVQDADLLVFVEVRARHNRRFGTPEESITPTKQAKLIELAHAYLQEHPAFEETPWRIDVIAIQLGAGLPQINHIQDAIGW